MSTPRRFWSDEETERVRREYADAHTPTLAALMGRSTRAVYQEALKLGVKKSAAYLASPLAGRTDGIRGGEGRFKTGHSTWNKGMKGLECPGSKATQFKKGEMRGAAQHNYVPIGTERMSKDGYLERKVNDDDPVATRRWVGVHVLIWTEANGPVPPAHAVVFKDKDRTHIALDNLELISRAELMQRNTVHNLPKELAQLVQLRGAVSRQINKRSKS